MSNIPVTVKVANVLSALFGIGFEFAYQSFTGSSTVPNAKVRGGAELFNSLQSSGPDLTTFHNYRTRNYGGF